MKTIRKITVEMIKQFYSTYDFQSGIQSETKGYVKDYHAKT